MAVEAMGYARSGRAVDGVWPSEHNGAGRPSNNLPGTLFAVPRALAIDKELELIDYFIGNA